MVPDPKSEFIAKEKVNSVTPLLAVTFTYKILRNLQMVPLNKSCSTNSM